VIITAQTARVLHDLLGDDAARELLDWMAQADRHRMELRELNDLMFARLDARFGEARHATRADLAEFRGEIQAEMGRLREELRGEMAGLREEVRTGLASLEARMDARLERRFGDLLKWSFVVWVGAVGAVALLAGALG
jgi:hypothetical protein